MRRSAVAVLVVTTSIALAPAAAAAGDHGHHGRPDSGRLPAVYELPGDPVSEGGSKFEGIGYDGRTGAFYVSETTGGEISRGNVRKPSADDWLAGDGTDGRWTARGITVDRAGRVYIAGGPNGIDHPGAPDLWVYSRSGRLLAALDTGVENALMNDVAIGPDGAAYFTNSNAPQVFRVAQGRRGWHVSTWVDATGTITQAPGFNLNGIVATPDGRALVSVQSNAGLLWRFDLRTRAVTRIAVPGADLTSGDGLVLDGRRLWVVRNFPRVLTTVTLARDARSGTLVSERATDPTRVLTTAKLAGGRLLAVDSKFDENPVGQPPYEVITIPVR